jgi:glucose/arabinose dehydrogenase
MNNLNQTPASTYRLLIPMVTQGLQEARDTLTLPTGELMTWREGQVAIASHKAVTGETLTLFNTQAA